MFLVAGSRKGECKGRYIKQVKATSGLDWEAPVSHRNSLGFYLVCSVISSDPHPATDEQHYIIVMP